MLIVEDGTGLSNAESYLSVAEADAYHEARDHQDWMGATTLQKEVALRDATAYVDARFRGRWLGARGIEGQALAWPRTGAYDGDGYAFADDAVPTRLKYAIAELALKALSEDIFPDVDAGSGDIKARRVKAGSVEIDTEYSGGASSFKRFSFVDALLREFTTSVGLLERM